jgi:hypothetical protein
MTGHYSSEQQLFQETQSDFPMQGEESKAKRRSFGPSLPVNPPNSPPRPLNMSSGNSRGGGGLGGTQLGMDGYIFDPEKGSQLVKKGEDGQEVRVDVFESVFTGGELSARKLELILNYLHFKGLLNFGDFVEGISYQGFNRSEYISSSLKRVNVSVFCRFAILGAIRGSNFDKIKESCLNMPADLSSLVGRGDIVKKPRKKNDMTILRFTASIPHWVSFWLFQVDVPKKIESEDCPGWLQYPGAASLPMGKKQRLQHISFCKAFSTLLPGGSFNGNIYFVAFSNQIPLSDVPSILKEHLGVGPQDSGSGEISRKEVQDAVTMTVARM